MLIVGELINSTRRPVGEALEAGNFAFIQDLALKQVRAGADYLDVNCGTRVDDEVAVMEKLVTAIQEAVQVPLCIDSPNPQALEVGLRLARYGQPMVNSISAEKDRFACVAPVVLQHRAKVVALCMDDNGLPETAEQHMAIGEKLIADLSQAGVPKHDIYLDPLVKPVSTSDAAGRQFLNAVRHLREKHPEVHTICGLSNISFGLPNRSALNQVFLVQAMTMGMDAYILDPLDKRMMGLFYASMALIGNDQYCVNYLKAFRGGLYQ